MRKFLNLFIPLCVVLYILFVGLALAFTPSTPSFYVDEIENAERLAHERLRVLAVEAPETLREPVRDMFSCLEAYNQAMAKYKARGEWSSEEGESSNACR